MVDANMLAGTEIIQRLKKSLQLDLKMPGPATADYRSLQRYRLMWAVANCCAVPCPCGPIAWWAWCTSVSLCIIARQRMSTRNKMSRVSCVEYNEMKCCVFPLQTRRNTKWTVWNCKRSSKCYANCFHSRLKQFDHTKHNIGKHICCISNI